MKRLAIIHIGTPKTGSTSIQQVLKHHRDEWPAQGACFPHAPGGGAAIHSFLTYAAANANFRPSDPVWAGMEPAERLEQFRREFTAEMDALPATIDRVIFSDERMSGVLRTTEQIGRLREILSPWFDRFMIVTYLRRQDTLLASQYSQMLRVGMLREPESLFLDATALNYFDYGRLMGLWAEVFGDAAINPRVYERGPGGNFDSVADFLGIAGLTVTLTEDDRLRTLNPSINLAGQKILREVGRILQEKTGRKVVVSPAWRAVTLAATKTLAGKGWSPTRDQARDFMRQFAEGNEEVRRRFRPERATLFTEDYDSLPAEPQALDPEEYFRAACATLVETLSVRAVRDKRAEWRARVKEAGGAAQARAATKGQGLRKKKKRVVETV